MSRWCSLRLSMKRSIHWMLSLRKRHAQLSFGYSSEMKLFIDHLWTVVILTSGEVGSGWAQGLLGCGDWALSSRTWSWGRCKSKPWQHSGAPRSCEFLAFIASKRYPRLFLRSGVVPRLVGTWRWSISVLPSFAWPQMKSKKRFQGNWKLSQWYLYWVRGAEIFHLWRWPWMTLWLYL